MVMPRRTKIVATLGPATDRPGVLERVLEAGVDVVRINLSHGAPADHRERVERVRVWAQAQGTRVGVIVDLQGPKIRLERFTEGWVDLEEGEPFVLDPAWPVDGGDHHGVSVAYRDLPRDVGPGDDLLLDDGRVVLRVDTVEGSAVRTTVVTGGRLSDRKGINRRGGGLSAPALTEKDRADITAVGEIAPDYVALSFPRDAADVHETRRLLREAGAQARVIAKIERAEALEAAEEIIDASDAIMVARGDLGVEIGDAALPRVQKELIEVARAHNRLVITATQMMESMIANPIPTRAEVFDVANAVLDGTDAVMLSAETAAGRYPAQAVAAMDRVCREAEKSPRVTVSRHRMNETFGRVDETIAMAAMYAANHYDVKAIIAMTESGATALWMSRISSGLPIYVVTPRVVARGRVTLFRGVYPLEFDPEGGSDLLAVKQALLRQLQTRGLVAPGDHVLVTHGERMGEAGGTNTMKIVTVEDALAMYSN